MKIFIDISVLNMASFITGIQRVTREIVLRLVKREDGEVVLMCYRASDNSYYQIDNQKFCDYYENHVGIKESMITKRKVDLSEISDGTIFFDLDAVWMSKVKRSFLLPILKSQGARIVVHVYDIISIGYPQYCQAHGVYHFMDYIGAHLLYADHIIVNANGTIEELKKLASRLDLLLPPCEVVPLGADFHKKKKDLDASKISDALEKATDKPYLLMVGTIEPRKNHKLLLDAYNTGLKELGYSIIFAGSMGWNMEQFENIVKNHPDFNQGVYVLQGLSDEEISYLYEHTRFLVFCSYMEGYGLPLVEAIQRGTPVLTANMSVSREVGGEYCDYFEQDNPKELIKLVQHYQTHEEQYAEKRNRLQKAKFISWNESACKMWDALVGDYGSE